MYNLEVIQVKFKIHYELIKYEKFITLNFDDQNSKHQPFQGEAVRVENPTLNPSYLNRNIKLLLWPGSNISTFS